MKNQKKIEVKLPEILLNVQQIVQIAEDLGVSENTVRNALKYRYKSEKAKAIRAKAKQLLKQEINKIETIIIK